MARIYQSGDATTVLPLLDRYDVRYVYVGRRERATYGTEQISKFSGFMRTAFDRDNVIIYERIEGFARQGFETRR